jgi:hypothetical protein
MPIKRKSKDGSVICDKCSKNDLREQAEPRTPIKVQRTASVPIPSLFTPKQEQDMRSTMQAEQLGQRGKSRSEGANARALLLLNSLQKLQSPLRSLSYDAKCKFVALAECTQPSFIRSIHSSAAAGETIAPAPVKRTMRADPAHKLYGEGGPTLAVETFLYEHQHSAGSCENCNG